jgi:hypothetical protein
MARAKSGKKKNKILSLEGRRSALYAQVRVNLNEGKVKN